MVAYALLGWPPGPRLRLDHRRFAYAGKFVVSGTGKAVALDDGDAPDAEGPVTLRECLLDEDDRSRLAREGATEGSSTDAVDGRSPAAAGWSLDAPVAGAVSFSADRTDAGTLWVRYVTVRADRRGDGVGPRLLAFLLDRAGEYDRVRIGVNNPFSYEAAYKAGFGWAGEERGLAELVCEWPAPTGRSPGRYRAGLDRFRGVDRELSEAETAFLASREGRTPPSVVTIRRAGGD